MSGEPRADNLIRQMIEDAMNQEPKESDLMLFNFDLHLTGGASSDGKDPQNDRAFVGMYDASSPVAKKIGSVHLTRPQWEQIRGIIDSLFVALGRPQEQVH